MADEQTPQSDLIDDAIRQAERQLDEKLQALRMSALGDEPRRPNPSADPAPTSAQPTAHADDDAAVLRHAAAPEAPPASAPTEAPEWHLTPRTDRSPEHIGDATPGWDTAHGSEQAPSTKARGWTPTPSTYGTREGAPTPVTGGVTLDTAPPGAPDRARGMDPRPTRSPDGHPISRAPTEEELQFWAQTRTALRTIQQATESLPRELATGVSDEIERVMRDELAAPAASLRQVQQQIQDGLPKVADRVERALHDEIEAPTAAIRQVQEELPLQLDRATREISGTVHEEVTRSSTQLQGGIRHDIEGAAASLRTDLQQAIEGSAGSLRNDVRDDTEEMAGTLRGAVRDDVDRAAASIRGGVREDVERVTSALRGDVQQDIGHLEKTVAANVTRMATGLGEQVERVEGNLGSVRDASAELGTLAEGIRATVARVESRIGGVEQRAERTEHLSSETGDGIARIERGVADTERSLEGIARSVTGVDDHVGRVEHGVRSEVGRLESSLRSTLDGLEQGLVEQLSRAGSDLRQDAASAHAALHRQVEATTTELRSDVSEAVAATARVEQALPDELHRVERSVTGQVRNSQRDLSEVLVSLVEANRLAVERMASLATSFDEDRTARAEDIELVVDTMTSGWEGMAGALTAVYEQSAEASRRLADVEQRLTQMQHVGDQVDSALNDMKQHLLELQPAPVIVTVNHPDATVANHTRGGFMAPRPDSRDDAREPPSGD